MKMYQGASSKGSIPAVSVIVPMYNAERHIQETLESLASQSLLNFEVIVVDDGSTDRSPEIVDAFVARDDRFSRVAGPTLSSAGAARNTGLDLARGEYLAFLDADDLFSPSMLEKLYAKAKADDADVVLTGFRNFDDITGEQAPQAWALRVQNLPARTPFAPGDIADHIFYVTNPSNWNKLFRREFVEGQGLRFQHLRRANDAYFTFVALAMSSRISYVAEELVLYRVGNAASLQGSIHESPLEFVEAILAISGALHAAGLDGRYQRAFKNLVATMSLGALARAKTAAAFVTTYSAVRDTLFPRFGLTVAPRDTFLASHVQRRVAEIVEKPVENWLFDRMIVPMAADVLAADPSGDAHSAGSTAEASPGPADEAVIRPDVSVIVPVYNSAAWLHECLLSVLAQSGVSLEVICVNDGSTDDSLSILHEYATSDARVVVVNRPNGGLSAARNSGLDVARGRYTCMIDSDDYWKLDGLADLVERADRDSLDVLLFDAESFFEPGVSESTHSAYATYYARSRSYSEVVTGPELIAVMREAKEYRPSACLYLTRTEFLAAARLRFIPGIMHEDNPFTFALLLNSKRAAHVQKPMYARRVRPGSIMTTAATQRSMQGYFASYLDMTRRLSLHSVPAELGSAIGDLVHHMYAASRRLFFELPEEIGNRIREADQSPEAHSAFLMLQYERSQVLKIRKLSRAR
ncbi:glycosyltransferase [Microbacterium sp. 2FI]|uniref:glycosyltransferase n=1 Tax=Microbacterium sp. 2FI TaxID=2502193 RepID=UPI0010F85A22|nr:glycosyltransferase [Microbacterium sp. 2FI]